MKRLIPFFHATLRSVAVVSILTAASLPAAAQLLTDMLANPTTPLSIRAQNNMIPYLTVEAANWITKANKTNANVGDLFRMADGPNRHDFLQLMNMAAAAMQNDPDGLQDLQVLRTSFRDFESVARANPASTEKYDAMMDHRNQLQALVEHIAHGDSRGLTPSLMDLAASVHTDVGAEALKMQEQLSKFIDKEVAKRNRGLPGANEAAIAISTTTVEMARFYLEKARRLAQINDPNNQMAAILIGMSKVDFQDHSCDYKVLVKTYNPGRREWGLREECSPNPPNDEQHGY